MRQKTAICLLYLFLSVLCYGQTGKLFTVDNELSSSMINSIYQDKEDIIWIATEDGLTDTMVPNSVYTNMTSAMNIPCKTIMSASFLKTRKELSL